MQGMTSLAMVLSALSVATADDMHPLTAYPPSDALSANIAWHKQTGENEIRTSWFLHGTPGIAMVCTADLLSSKVTTSREVYERGSQAIKTRELSHSQVITLTELIKHLAASAGAPELKNLLLVSVRQHENVETHLYDRSAPPQDIIRLYDLSGAYLGTEGFALELNTQAIFEKTAGGEPSASKIHNKPPLSMLEAIEIAEQYLASKEIDVSNKFLSSARYDSHGPWTKGTGFGKGPLWVLHWKTYPVPAPGGVTAVVVYMDGKVGHFPGR
jgi:hypothetical protein